MNNEETVVIKLSEYKRLLEAEDWLECLNAAGVDNCGSVMDEAIDIQEENPFDFEQQRNDI